MEIFKDIKGYEGMYHLSNYGNVKSLERKIGSCKYLKNIILKEKLLVNSICNNGYKYVSLSKNNKHKRIRVHRLVASSFLENNFNYADVNHIDGNKLNNHVSNLEWISRSGNIKHAYDTGLRKKTSVLSDYEAYVIRYKILGVSQQKIASAFNCSQMVISNIKNYRTYKNV